MEVEQTGAPQIDEALYSRQLYVLGHETMKKMGATHVLIVGLGGLGIEIAKNIILTGVKSVTLHDEANVSWSDLSAQFYLTEKDVGANRATASLKKLSDLNQYVQVRAHTEKITPEYLQSFQVVVFTEGTFSQLTQINEACRKMGVRFVVAEARGLSGFVFCDFGEGFVVSDVNGEDPVSAIVTSISQDDTGVVTTHEDSRHGLETGDFVTFSDVEGMVELNDCEPREVKVTGPYTFTIGSTAGLSSYLRGGYVRQVKMPKTVNFKSLADSIAAPEVLMSDFAKMERPAHLHVAYQALHAFVDTNGRQPRPQNAEDAQAIVDLAQKINSAAPTASKVDKIDEDVVRKVAMNAAGVISPVCAFLGGVAAQEVLKACSGKFHPLYQWLYFDAFEAMPATPVSESDAAPLNSRYDGQIAVFGKSFQEKLARLKHFVVGAGALGCEFLKMLAMMGVGASPEGGLVVTDMDTIETSNLSRQFLFRRSHVGKLKSETAAMAAKEMNPALNIRSLSDKVAPETEAVFDDEFWESLDCVINALDNVQARLYVDARCIYYRKPLLESGTLGTKANVQVVLPHLTESYGSSRDPPEKQIPICTLKNFPNAIEHTIQWARDLFEGFFRGNAEDANAYLSRPDFIDMLDKQPGTKLQTLTNVHASLKDRPVLFEECIAWARMRFEDLYNHQIRQLLHSFPVDMVTSSGAPFWSGPKRPPGPLAFDAEDPLHLEFVMAAANLRAVNYGLHGERDAAKFKVALGNVMVPDFVPKNVKIATTDQEQQQQEQPAASSTDDDETKIKTMISELPSPKSLAGYRMNAIEFEKDDPTNWHMEFVTAASNLRARNYKIPEADLHKTKLIAGKIIPAMITTTALVTGLVGIEVLKVIQGHGKIEDYKNAFLNLALPFFAFSEPIAAPKQKYCSTEWSLWDRFEIAEGKELSLREFIQYFKDKHNLEVTMISCGASIIYSFFGNKKKIEERMPMPMSEVVHSISKAEFLPKQRYLNFEICANDADDNEVEVPYVRYRFRF